MSWKPGTASFLGHLRNTPNMRKTSLYLQLKWQRTVFDECKQDMENFLKQKGPNEILSSLIGMIDKLCECTYGTLYPTTIELIRVVHNLIADPKLDESARTLTQKCLKTLIITSECVQKGVIYETPSSFRRWTDIGKMVEEFQGDEDCDKMVCRICEEKVSVSLFEEHIESCCLAHQSEARIAKLNRELETLRTTLCNDWLGLPWPGKHQNPVYAILPAFRAMILLTRGMALDPYSTETPEEIDVLMKHFADGNLDVTDRGNELATCAQVVQTIKRKLMEKKHISSAIRHVSELKKKSGRSSTVSTEVQISDFEFIKRISSGAYARVFLARKIATNDIYAIKVLKRDDVKQKNQMKRVLAERDILMRQNNGYIIEFYWSIIGNNNLYLVMEYVPGGDMKSMLSIVGCVDEASAKIYTYQIVKALASLHSMGIIHRDLKPDNILISETGNIKLTDFGLSYMGMVGRHVGEVGCADAKSCVGTPGYVAPEIILSQSHSFGVDWWSLGVIVYELLCGVTPFTVECEEEEVNEDLNSQEKAQQAEQTKKKVLEQIQVKILTRDYTPLDPEEDDVTPEAVDFIDRLLCLDPSKRLGANGPDEILSHPWLKDVNPDKPVFIPHLKSRVDTQFFKETSTTFQKDKDDDIKEDMANIGRLLGHGRKSQSFVVTKPVVPGQMLRACDILKEPPKPVGAPEQEEELDRFAGVAVDHLARVNHDQLAREKRRRTMTWDKSPETPIGEDQKKGRSRHMSLTPAGNIRNTALNLRKMRMPTVQGSTDNMEQIKQQPT